MTQTDEHTTHELEIRRTITGRPGGRMDNDDTSTSEIPKEHTRDTKRHRQQRGNLSNRPRLHTKIDDHAPVMRGEHLVNHRIAGMPAGGHQRLKSKVVAGTRAPTGVRIRANQGTGPGQDHRHGALSGLLRRGLTRRRVDNAVPDTDSWRATGVKLLGTLGFTRRVRPKPCPGRPNNVVRLTVNRRDGRARLASSIAERDDTGSTTNSNGGRVKGGGRGGGGPPIEGGGIRTSPARTRPFRGSPFRSGPFRSTRARIRST